MYNNVRYVYRKDVQGNIIAILDSTGNVVVEYKYDAWGNHKVLGADGNEITSTGHIGYLNPFRYRSYYYDTETKLYYLQTRYYDPEVGRFINMDSIDYADPETINGLNLYSYCDNNPVSYIDSTGHAWWHWLIAVAVVVALAALTVVSAGSVAAGAAAISAATYGATAAGASAVTTTLAFATVGAGTTLAATAVVATIDSVETCATGGSLVDGVNTFMNEGESAMWSTIGAGVVDGTVGYFSSVDYGTHTPSKLRPFGTFYNSNDKTITHYGLSGKMWWSKHLTDHGRPDKHVASHWHAEMPHYPNGGFESNKDLFKELLKRLFGGGNR